MGLPHEAGKIYAQLREAQRRVPDALQEIYTESIDLSPAIKAAREYVTGKPSQEAILAVATVTQPTNFGKATKTARELMLKFPLQNITGGVKIDNNGCVVAHKTPAFASNENEAKQALWERVVEHVTMTYQIGMVAQIIPAINQLTFEHSLILSNMEDLVANNPFVPPGQEELFAKGFLAGFQWNFPEALSLLVPQLENSLRYLLAREAQLPHFGLSRR